MKFSSITQWFTVTFAMFADLLRLKMRNNGENLSA